MKAYPEYKASGIDWLGEMPSHWTITRLGLLFYAKAGGDANPNLYSDIKDDLHPYPVYTNSLLEEQIYAYTSVAPYKSGSITVTGRGNIGKAFVRKVDFDAIIRLIVLTPKIELCNEYYKYFIDIVPFFTDSAAVGQLSASQISNYKLSLPPIEEQVQIAAYLDNVTGKIDELVKEKQAQLDDIRAYRTSLITEAVTRGLNPDAPLKDSGIDWLGEIPAHWSISKLGFVSTVQTGTTPSTAIEKYWDTPTRNWYTPSDFNSMVLECSKRKVSPIVFEEDVCRKFPPFTVLLIGIGATLGKVAYSKTTCSANQQINAVIFDSKVNPIFGCYYLFAINDIIRSASNAATLPILNQEQTKKLQIVLPPLEEQSEIADFLDAQTAKIDELIQTLSKQIEDLAEYKRAVITEAVTGKVDVRDWKPKA